MRSDHLLASSFALRLLLLTQRLSLILLLLHLLSHTFTLGRRIRHALGSLLFYLLLANFLHLLPRTTIAASCLSRQVSHLPLSCLLGGYVWRLTSCLRLYRLLRCCRTFISELQLLILSSFWDGLYPQSARQISSERRSGRRCASYHGRIVYSLRNCLGHIDVTFRITRLKRGPPHWINRQRIKNRSDLGNCLGIDPGNNSGIDHSTKVLRGHDRYGARHADINNSFLDYVCSC